MSEDKGTGATGKGEEEWEVHAAAIMGAHVEQRKHCGAADALLLLL